MNMIEITSCRTINDYSFIALLYIHTSLCSFISTINIRKSKIKNTIFVLQKMIRLMGMHKIVRFFSRIDGKFIAVLLLCSVLHAEKEAISYLLAWIFWRVYELVWELRNAKVECRSVITRFYSIKFSISIQFMVYCIPGLHESKVQKFAFSFEYILNKSKFSNLA